MWQAARFEARHAWRRMRGSPAVSLSSIATLALALGATIAVASLAQGLLLRTVTAADPSRLVSVSVTDKRTGQAMAVDTAVLAAYGEAQRSLSITAMYAARVARVETETIASDAVVESVSSAYFGTMGIRPSAGRFFNDDDRNVVVIGARLQRRLFAEDGGGLGHVVKLNGRSVQVIGFAPDGFDGLQFDGGVDVLLPIASVPAIFGGSRVPRARHLIGLLAPGAHVTDVRAELSARWPAIARTESSLPRSTPGTDETVTAEATPIAHGFSTMRDLYGSSLVALFGLAAVLLIIAGANVTGLMIARALGQRHEVTVRLAVGASARRVMAQFVADGVLLALCGLVPGVLMAWWATSGLTSVLDFARATPITTQVTPGGVLVAAATLTALAVGATAGLVASLSVSRAGLVPWRSVTGQPRYGRHLVILQVAVSVLPLVGLSLFATTLWHLRSNSDTIDAHNVILTRLARMPGDTRPIDAAYLQSLTRELSGLPNASRAALSVFFPAYFLFDGPLPTDRYSAPDTGARAASALTDFVSPGFFDTYGVALLRGRDFTWRDDARSPSVAIVSRTLARALFGETGAVGRRLHTSTEGGTPEEYTVVGIVADGPFGTLREPHQATVFRPALQSLAVSGSPMAHVRFDGNTAAAAKAYERAVERYGRHYVRKVFTFEGFTGSVLLKERGLTLLSTFVGLLTMALACLGIYSLLAHAVASRTREIGVRTALGATRGDVVRMVLGEGFRVAAWGVSTGAAVWLAMAGAVRSQLYGAAPRDPALVTCVSMALLLAIVAASLVPALRAARIDSAEALRS